MEVEIPPTITSASAAHPQNGRRFDSPITDWPWWCGPLGLLLALVFAVFAGLVVDLPLMVAGVHVNAPKTPGGVIILDTAVQDVIFVATPVLFLRMRGRRLCSWQLGLRPTLRFRALLLIVATFVAFFLFSVIWGVLVGSEKEQVLEQLGAKEGTALLIASAALTCVIAPICEEILFRGFIFTALRNLRGPWVAAVLTGLLFGAVHGVSAPAIDLLPLAALGFALCLLYRATGSLYPCIAVHAVNNSIAFGGLEEWGWQIPVLLVAALASIAVLVLAARAIGLIGGAGPPADAMRAAA